SVAGVINVMAGGGSTLTLPTLIFLGLDGATANGTNRVAIVLQNLFATLSFRQEKVSRVRQTLMFAVCALPGALLGALVAVRISDEWFQRILGIIMIGVVISMLFSRSDASKPTTPEGTDTWWIYPALFGIGFYGGFIQVGVGFLFMAAFYHLMRMNLVFVNMHKVAVVLLYTIPALLIFAWTGHVDWKLGLSLALGNAFGGWWAAKLAVRKGEKVIRYVLVVAVLIMAIKILNLV
ncbi:MAG: sulfite exporter TauE/SafE family protein, partial [Rhodothermales bacterium]